jgi:hypothetical protein
LQQKPRQRLKALSTVDSVAANRSRGIKPPTGLLYNLTSVIINAVLRKLSEKLNEKNEYNERNEFSFLSLHSFS